MVRLFVFFCFIFSTAQEFPQSDLRPAEVKNPAILTVSSVKYDKYKLKNFVRAGASVRLCNELDRCNAKEIIRLNPNLVTVVGTRFDKIDMKDFVRAGAYVLITNKFDKYDAKEIISLNPTKVTVIATGFDRFAINEFIKVGAKVVIGVE